MGSPVNRAFVDAYRSADDRRAVKTALELLFADPALPRGNWSPTF